MQLRSASRETASTIVVNSAKSDASDMRDGSCKNERSDGLTGVMEVRSVMVVIGRMGVIRMV